MTTAESKTQEELFARRAVLIGEVKDLEVRLARKPSGLVRSGIIAAIHAKQREIIDLKEQLRQAPQSKMLPCQRGLIRPTQLLMKVLRSQVGALENVVVAAHALVEALPVLGKEIEELVDALAAALDHYQQSTELGDEPESEAS